MKELNRHKQYLEITTVIANLEAKLYDAKQKHPEKKFEEQEFIVRVLKEYHYSHMELEEENRIMDKKYVKASNERDIIKKKYLEELKISKGLKDEVENLKNNIQ